jgi:hypothetical protein
LNTVPTGHMWVVLTERCFKYKKKICRILKTYSQEKMQNILLVIFMLITLK